MWVPDNPTEFDNPDSVLLIACWHELFDGYTPDSFQPRLHNVASLVEELVEIAHWWQREPKAFANVKPIKAELAAAIKSEKDILSRIPTYHSRCLSLVDAKSPAAIISSGRILAGQRKIYRNAFELVALEAISNLPTSKKDAVTSVRRLSTFAFQHGKEDDDAWDPLSKDPTKAPTELFQEMSGLANGVVKDFTCTLTILGDEQIMNSTVRTMGHRVLSSKSLPDGYAASIGSTNGQPIHVCVNVKAKSIREAVAKARDELELAIGFASLYRNPAELRLHTTAHVAATGYKRTFLQSEQAFRRLHPRARAKTDIKGAIKMTAGTVDHRILAAVRQLALASASTDNRTRFINLWSALETLAGAHEGENAMDRVRELIIPLVISRHVHRTTRYMTILTQRFGNRIGSAAYGLGFRPSETGLVRLDDMLVTLSSKCNDPKIKDLLHFADHPLLRYRLFDTWKLFHDPKYLRERLIQSQDRLGWQLARIYRARNLLVHEGQEVRHIVPLLDNLQNYLSMLVQRLVHETKRKSHHEWDVRHCIEYWNGRMSHVLNGLKEEPSRLTTRGFLEKCDRIPLWQDVD